MYIDISLKNYIDETNSKNATPGGGSVSALAGALGAALTNMVGHLSVEKKFFLEYDRTIREDFHKAMQLQEENIKKLEYYLDADTKAFDGVMEALKLPKTTEEEKTYRKEKIQEGYKEALEIPMVIAETCLSSMRNQKIFAEKGNIQAISDVGVGVLLLSAALEGALFNVRINLKSIQDPIYAEEKQNCVKSYMKEMQNLKQDLLGKVYERLEEK